MLEHCVDQRSDLSSLLRCSSLTGCFNYSSERISMETGRKVWDGVYCGAWEGAQVQMPLGAAVFLLSSLRTDDQWGTDKLWHGPFWGQFDEDELTSWPSQWRKHNTRRQFSLSSRGNALQPYSLHADDLLLTEESLYLYRLALKFSVTPFECALIFRMMCNAFW